MTDVEGATGESGFTSVGDQQPKHASGGLSSSLHHGNGYEAKDCCYSPLTLVLVIFASLCFTPAGWIARRYYAEGETKKAQLVSVLGIFVGSIITAAAIAVLVLYVTGRIG